MTIYHKHHIIPKHLGGTDDPDNLVVVTIEQHAALHKQLWEDLGHWEDKLAWQALSGQITNAEANLIAAKEGALKGAKKPKSIEMRKKLSEFKKGKKMSEETKSKLSEKAKGRTGYWKGKNMPDSAKQKLSDIGKTLVGEKNPFFGRKHSEETKQKIRETKLKNSKILNNQMLN